MLCSVSSSTGNLQQEGSPQPSFDAMEVPQQLPPCTAITNPLNCLILQSHSDCSSSTGAQTHNRWTDCEADLLSPLSLQSNESRRNHHTGRAILHLGEYRNEPNEEIRTSQHNELWESCDPQDTLHCTPENEPRQEDLTAHTLESYDPDRPSRYAGDFMDEEMREYEHIFVC